MKNSNWFKVRRYVLNTMTAEVEIKHKDYRKRKEKKHHGRQSKHCTSRSPSFAGAEIIFEPILNDWIMHCGRTRNDTRSSACWYFLPPQKLHELRGKTLQEEMPCG